MQQPSTTNPAATEVLATQWARLQTVRHGPYSQLGVMLLEDWHQYGSVAINSHRFADSTSGQAARQSAGRLR
jgi:hypothetical protein